MSDDKENEIIESNVCEWSRRSDASGENEPYRLFVVSQDGGVMIEDCRTTSHSPRAQRLIRVPPDPYMSDKVDLTRSETRWLIAALTKALAFADEFAGEKPSAT